MKPSGQPNHHPARGKGRHAPATKGASGGGRRSKNNLVALGSAAVLAIYAAGYIRTRSAAQRLAEPEHRRPVAPDRAANPPAAQPTVPAPAEPAGKSPETPGTVAPPPTATAVTATPIAPVPVALPPPAAAASNAPAPAALPPPSPPPVAVAVGANPTSAAVPTPATTATAPAGAPAAATPSSTSSAGNVSASATSAPAAAAQSAAKWKDGIYRAWGHCRHGDLEATVEIRGGRIYSAAISQCLTRYSCDVIDMLPGQAVARQSPEVDIVTGSTQSSDAFYDALVAALKQATL